MILGLPEKPFDIAHELMVVRCSALNDFLEIGKQVANVFFFHILGHLKQGNPFAFFKRL